MLHPCACGGLVDCEQAAPNQWIIRCRKCSAMTVGDDEKSVAVRWESGNTILRERIDNGVKFVAGVEQDCCKDPRNLRYHGRRYDLTIHVCAVCQRKHYKLWCEPGKIFGEMGPQPQQHRTFDVSW